MPLFFPFRITSEVVHIHVFLPLLQYPHAGLCDNRAGHCFLSFDLLT